jgi:hypothetical protein
MKNCYCKKYDKLVTNNEFSSCSDCGDNRCQTILLNSEESYNQTVKYYSEYSTMKKLVRNYKRQEKLKRILK